MLLSPFALLNKKKWVNFENILEFIQKEFDLEHEEQVAKERVAKLGQLDNFKEGDVQECALDLGFDQDELEIARESVKKLAQKKESTGNF